MVINNVFTGFLKLAGCRGSSICQLMRDNGNPGHTELLMSDSKVV